VGKNSKECGSPCFIEVDGRVELYRSLQFCRFIEGSSLLLTAFLQIQDGLYWDKYMALLRYVVLVATAIETWCKYPLLLDLHHIRYFFRVRRHENNESNNHNFRNVVQNNSMWYTLNDLESTVNWKLTKRAITYH